ncbi:HNH endonuclease [Halosimplex pelagicum]|uniref:HNH endonuclease n=1 Tax=Halosimplex pelagicum TaxID=869886 RepID=A0A7D5P9B1_9EURY|nr:HNH endonuclease signature motif containing protein [Halosimplex pelagicum]QLH80965.1 HNH endonuclease [Halosimplex pelagicum]
MARGAYTGEKWAVARSAALARDNGRCQDCGSEDDLHVHHIKPVREFDVPADAHYVENLVVLCKYCHKTWEGRDDRPRLAEVEPGLLVREVVSELVTDTVDRFMLEVTPEVLYDRVVWFSSNICTNCHERATGRSLCPGCGASNGAKSKQTLSVRESIDRTHTLIDRLEDRDIPFDEDVLYDTVRELKSEEEMADDREMYRQAVGESVRAAVQ